MSGMEPMLIGAAAGAALNQKNPIQGAMLGGFVGGAGGALMPGLSNLGGASSGLTPGILPSAASGSTVVNPAMAGQAFTAGPTAAMNAANLTTGPTSALGVEASKAGLFAGSPVTQPFVSSDASTGFIPSSMYEPTLMDRVGDVGQYAQQNPVLTQMAMQGAQGLLQQQPSQPTPAGLMRGNPMQVQVPQYQFGPPKISLI